MSVYVYCLKTDYRYQSSITGREFENDWFRLSQDGMVIVKGANYKGYAWDGCSPKFKIKDWYFGAWEAVLNFDTGQSKTYYASLVHDVFYQFSKELRSFIKRKEVDQEFYHILKRDGLRLAEVYYLGVRLFGWLFWGNR
jgi:hypothetical protein